MSTIKISELNPIALNANTSNTILVGVDLPTSVTGKISATSLAQGLYSGNPLNVGGNSILFPNTIAQFSGNSVTYLQTNFQNYTPVGSVDIVLTSDIGTNSNNYLDLGINNSQYSDINYSSMYPLDGYLYVSGPSGSSNTGNLVIGTASYGANINFIVGGTTSANIGAVFNENWLTLQRPTIINQIPINSYYGNFPALTINNYGNSYSLLVNDTYPTDSSPFAIDNNGNTSIGTLSSNGYMLYVAGNTFIAGNVRTSGVLTLADGSNPASNAFVSSNDSLTFSSAVAYTNIANNFLQANIIAGIASANAYTNVANNWLQANDALTFTASRSYTNIANNFLQANDASTFASAVTYTNTANNFLQANDSLTFSASQAYTDSANSWIRSNYLANTSNTLFNGTLNISDKLNVNGSVIFANTNFSNTQSALTIAACPIGDVQLPSNDGYMLHISGKQNVSSRIVFDSFGANTYGVIAGRTARGTPTAPQAVANGDILMRMSGNGYGTTKYSTLGSGRIDIVATENFTDASRATQIQFFTTIAGTNTQTQIASFNGSSATFTGVVNPQKGFIYNPNVISGIINSLSIDIANNSLYKFNCNVTTTISLSGFQSGKVVEVWLTNIDTGAGSNHTITHGCFANNSTIGTTSFTLTSLHSAYLRYFSIDGDLANTFVSINYS